MTKIKIEKVGDVNFTYPYLEVFINDSTCPSIDISVNEEKHLVFKFYKSQVDEEFSLEEMEYILTNAKNFLSGAIADQDAFDLWSNSS